MARTEHDVRFATVAELKNQLSRYLRRARREGEPIVVTLHGKPYALIQALENEDLEELEWKQLANRRLADAWEGEDDALYDDPSAGMTPVESRKPERVDLLVVGGTVLTMDAGERVVKDGAVAISDGAIAAVGTRRSIESRFRARRSIDARGGLILPGFVNAHTHAPMTLLRGAKDDVDLMTWLTKYMFPIEKRFVSREFVRWGALLACWEMIASGTTTFADGYFYEEEVARAADEAGLRAVPGQGIFEVPTPDSQTAADGLARAEKFLSDWSGHPRITPSLCPHSCYTVERETFRKTMRLAQRFDAPVQTHLAESPAEIAMVRERFDTTPVRHLASVGALDGRLVAAHCVCVDDDEIALLAKSGAGVVHCPESNMKLASGVAPIGKMLAERVRLGLGTDGAASNNDLDMIGEMGSAARLHKVATLDPTAAPARAVLRMATLGGAEALHMQDRVGSLEPGRRADVVVLGLSSPAALPLFDPVSHVVYSARSDAVETVIVEGRVLMDRRRIRTLDTEAIRRHAERFGRKIRVALPD
ncbi:MAG TPA: type II toxin-antitoxin system prevent-host-death family antitoxin [Thermoanaerobaculia bacterium]|jgi:5-methylthioadenosine/S-adenosylhomocysteine deaminase|nr:type II toxin-antitoxin system prevent-host-death family antitoxin [Thermoanaerobaculia bacterium]